MATIKTGNSTGKYHDENSTYDVINYILNPNKTLHDIIGCSDLSVCLASASRSDWAKLIAAKMEEVDCFFNKNSGVRLHHFIVSFEEINDPFMAGEIANLFSSFFAKQYQVVYAVHEDTVNVHFHLVFNAVSFIDGRKYLGSRTDFYNMKQYLKSILFRYGIKKLIYIPARSCFENCE